MNKDLAQKFREALASGQILRGDRLLPERDLARHFEVPRTRLRQLLDQLEHQGVLFRRQGQGTFLSPPPSPGSSRLNQLARRVTPHEIMEVRHALEPALAALAAERGSTKDVARLCELAETSHKAPDMARYEELDDLFHHKIAQTAKNALFLDTYESLRSVRQLTDWTRPRAELYRQSDIASQGAQHIDITDAIAAGDAKGARAAMAAHLQNAHNILRSLDQSPEE